MELKRYVLFRGEILEVIKPSVLEIGNTITFQAEGVYDFRFQLDKKDVKKTSNNILDFVEVGDLIEIPQTIIKVDNVNNNGSFETLVSREYSKVTAIYKRQANGDYKRYEVKS